MPLVCPDGSETNLKPTHASDPVLNAIVTSGNFAAKLNICLWSCRVLLCFLLFLHRLGATLRLYQRVCFPYLGFFKMHLAFFKAMSTAAVLLCAFHPSLANGRYVFFKDGEIAEAEEDEEDRLGWDSFSCRSQMVKIRTSWSACSQLFCFHRSSRLASLRVVLLLLLSGCNCVMRCAQKRKHIVNPVPLALGCSRDTKHEQMTRAFANNSSKHRGTGDQDEGGDQRRKGAAQMKTRAGMARMPQWFLERMDRCPAEGRIS